MPRERLPGAYLREKDLESLPGVVRYRPEAKYTYSAGQAYSEFLKGLKEGVIRGVECPRCGRVFVPPRSYCEYCFQPTTRWVDLPGTGTVNTAVVSYISTFRERLDKPEIIGVIRLDAPGYREDSYEFAGLFHRLCNVDPREVVDGSIIGAKVRPRWKPESERRGDINDIECFEPVR